MFGTGRLNEKQNGGRTRICMASLVTWPSREERSGPARAMSCALLSDQAVLSYTKHISGARSE